MAKRKTTKKKTVATITHDDEKRTNIPTAEQQSVVSVPIDQDGRFYLLEKVRPVPPSGPYLEYPPTDFLTSGIISLEFPRGYADAGERPEETARREGAEETGFVIHNVKQIGEVNTNTTKNLKSIPVFLGFMNDHHSFEPFFKGLGVLG